jgi:predicted nucleotidyltransferase
MLIILNNLMPFFEDCYRRINVREYAKIVGISPPTASKLLHYYKTQKLLKMEKHRNYIFYFANKDSRDFIDLSRTYWRFRLKGFISLMEKKLTSPSLILFGSVSKAEVRPESDVDITVFSIKKECNLREIERKLKRKIQLFWFPSIEDIKSRELALNIMNGYVLCGSVE